MTKLESTMQEDPSAGIYAAAVHAIGICLPPSATIVRRLHRCLGRYRATQVQAPTVADVWRAVDGIVANARAIEGHLELLRIAARGTARSDGDRKILMDELYRGAAEALTLDPEVDHFDPHGPLDVHGFAAAANRVRQLAERLAVGNLAAQTRPRDAAFEILIGDLATIYVELTGEQPSAARRSGSPEYRTPFSRFVAALWGELEPSPAPSSKRIGAALRRSHRLRVPGACNSGDILDQPNPTGSAT